jgi:hypothetical protein
MMGRFCSTIPISETQRTPKFSTSAARCVRTAIDRLTGVTFVSGCSSFDDAGDQEIDAGTKQPRVRFVGDMAGAPAWIFDDAGDQEIGAGASRRSGGKMKGRAGKYFSTAYRKKIA